MRMADDGFTGRACRATDVADRVVFVRGGATRLRLVSRAVWGIIAAATGLCPAFPAHARGAGRGPLQPVVSRTL